MERQQEILGEAIILFSDKGYENTTIKDIALAANTIPAEIYNYYIGKEALLEAIYDCYSSIIMAEKPTPEEYIPVLESGTAEDILNIFNFPLPEPADLNFRVIRIVLSRKLSDKRAMNIYLRHAWETALEYLHEVLTKGIEMGRLAMSSEDIKTLAHLVHGAREYSANMATIIPEQAAWRKFETDMIRQLSTLLKLNDPIDSATAPEVDIPTALEEIIQCESLSVGKYSHYSATLKRMGQVKLSHFIDEIIENLMDEIDTLYVCAGEDENIPDWDYVINYIANNEKAKRMYVDKVASHTGGDVSDVFSQIAALARQHERLCHLKQKNAALEGLESQEYC